IGFNYINEVDPFDGGPHYRCKLKDIKPIKNMLHAKIKFVAESSSDQRFLITFDHPDHDFFSLYIKGQLLAGLEQDTLALDESYKKLIPKNIWEEKVFAIEI